jgi:imidazolonepropionase-like amidohydrolase
LKALLALAVVAALAAAVILNLPPGIDYGAVHRIDRDVRLADVLDRLKAQSRSGTIVFAGVSIVDPVTAQLVPAQSVIVRDGRIEWVGPAAEMSVPADGFVIDGRGRYLSPGLTDMHVHTAGIGEHILRLSAGVTAVRDMDGFPWLLRLRDAIAHRRTLGATMYVAGTIIADQPFYGYAVVVKTPEGARRVVRDQKACGYSFIKVHNSLSQPLFDAVADEAHRVGLDFVGHVPHDISLEHAVHSAHMRTLEHLKGFLFDRTLLPNPEEFARALAGAEVWLAPTFYARRSLAYGDEAKQLLADSRMRFATRADRAAWAAGVPAAGSRDAQLSDTLKDTHAKVMARLLPLHPRWLAGTDAAGYAFNIAGYALVDELALMHEAGIAVSDVIRAATTEAAAAMRQTDFGQIASAMRADLVLLESNPLEDLRAYQKNAGVMARGVWMDRAALDAALDALANIYAEPTPTRFAAEAAATLAREAEVRVARGHVFETAALIAAAAALKNAGQPAAAFRLEKLANIPTSGPCAAVWPN